MGLGAHQWMPRTSTGKAGLSRLLRCATPWCLDLVGAPLGAAAITLMSPACSSFIPGQQDSCVPEGMGLFSHDGAGGAIRPVSEVFKQIRMK